MFKIKLMSLVFVLYTLISIINSVELYAENPGQLINDPANDVSIDHINVTSVSSSLSGEILTSIMQLIEVPAQLMFNRTGVPKDALEYAWTIYIDVDNNQQTGNEVKGFLGIDYALAATHFAFLPGINQMKPISQAVQTNTWKANESGNMSYLNAASIVVSDQSNTITLSGSIPGISINSNIYFFTFDYNPDATFQADKGGEKLYTQEELNQAISEERRKWDIDDDNKKGILEAINALQVVSGVKGQ